MSPEKRQTAGRLVQAALTRAPQERAAFITAACAGDEVLRQEVETLLNNLHGQAGHRQTGPLVATQVETAAIEVPANGATQTLDASKLDANKLDGRMLGHYQLLSEIGRGGMGRVYLAHDQRLGRRVALKLLLRQSTRSPERVQRFKQEARAASALNHPNILTIYEIGELKGVHFLATEFVEGRTLRAIVEHGQATLLTLLDIAIQTAEALAVAHSAGIVHRDIKPENLMLRPDGYVKVLDFGIAKLTEAAAANSGEEFDQFETRAGVVVGTVNYMSPEQARGLRVDQRTDVFSLGVVLYEMTTGKKPFNGPTPSDVVAAVLKNDPPPLAQHLSGTPAALQHIINRALQKERTDRYSSALEMAADLKQLKQELEFAARFPSSGDSGRVRLASQADSNPNFATRAVSAELAATSTDERAAVRTAENSASFALWQKRKPLLLVALLIACLTLALAGWFYFTRARTDSIAVLPFAYARTAANGNEADAEYLADGLTESLIQRLSQTPALKVIARNSVFRYKGKDADPQEIAAAFNVRTVLNGRIQPQGDKLEINVELVDTGNSTVLWSQRYVRPMTGLVNLQSDIASEIAGQLQMRLSGETQLRLAKRDTENVEAYQLYLRGRHLWNQRTAEGLRQSIECFQQAIRLDPNYARAYAGLADTHALLSAYTDAPARESYDQGQAAVAKAIELDPQLAEPHGALGLMLNSFHWDFAGAEREFQRAIALNPNYATAHHWYGNQLIQMGRFDDARIQTALAKELDPVSPAINTAYGTSFYYARRYDEAVAQFQKTVALAPSFGGIRSHLADAFERRGEWPQAINELNQAVSLSHNNPAMRLRLARAYAYSQRKDEARQRLAQLQQEYPNTLSPYLLAEVYVALGEREAALNSLARSFAEKEESVLWLKVDPRMDALRQEPRFQELLRQVGLR